MFAKLVEFLKGSFDSVLLKLFSDLPLLREFNGKKRAIGEFLIATSAALAALQELFPGCTSIAAVAGAVGFAVKILGDLHSDAKDRAVE